MIHAFRNPVAFPTGPQSGWMPAGTSWSLDGGKPLDRGEDLDPVDSPRYWSPQVDDR